MGINFHPKSGQILLCDFHPGFRKPEMIKSGRPVVVLTGPIEGRSNLATVVPLSTSKPSTLQPYHFKIPKELMPMLEKYQKHDSWVKGDMIYTVGFHRLRPILLNKRDLGKERYFKNRIEIEVMKQIYQCILHGLDLSNLVPYL